jgi:ATP-binding cassette, subfamily G (WHITE), member 2
MVGLSVSIRNVCYTVPSNEDPGGGGGGWLLSSTASALRRIVNRDPPCASSASGDEEDPAAARDGAHGKASRKLILNGVSADVQPGELLAVMSASGGGKTSLLNVISARVDPGGEVDGAVLFDGRPRDARLRRRIGFCTQDDCFFSQLTVRETLEFTAAVVIEDPAERAGRVEEVLERFGLGKCANTRVGSTGGGLRGVSGGERRRCSLANEMLARPALYVADEPISGLDATTAYNVMRVLRGYADEGHSVIATVHQPSVAIGSLFSKVLLLSEGNVVWTGPVAAMEPYLTECGYPFPSGNNPWEFVLHLLMEGAVDADVEGGGERDWGVGREDREDLPSRESASTTASGKSAAAGESPRDHLVRLWRERMEKVDGGALEGSAKDGQGVFSGARRAVAKRTREVLRRTPEDETPKYATSFWSQTKTLAGRALIQKRSTLFEKPAITQMLITTSTSVFWWRLGKSERYLDDRTGALSFFAAFWSFTGALISLHSFPPEKEVLNKDRSAGIYRLSAYYIGKMVVEFPLDIIYPLIFSLISYFVIGLRLSVQQFLIYWTIISLTVLAASSVGLAASAAVMHAKWAQIITTGYLLWSMMLSGYYSDTRNQPAILRALRKVSAIRYSYEALLRNEFSGGVYPCEVDAAMHTVYSQAGAICPITEEAALRGAQVEDSFSIAGCAGMLVVLIVVVRLAGYLALKHFHTRHKVSK